MHEDIENVMLAIWQSNLARLGQGTAIGVGGRLREIIAKEKDSLKGIYVLGLLLLRTSNNRKECECVRVSLCISLNMIEEGHSEPQSLI